MGQFPPTIVGGLIEAGGRLSFPISGRRFPPTIVGGLIEALPRMP
jgi:hypothetical protein